jgi:hypothetical protein
MKHIYSWCHQSVSLASAQKLWAGRWEVMKTGSLLSNLQDVDSQNDHWQ